MFYVFYVFRLFLSFMCLIVLLSFVLGSCVIPSALTLVFLCFRTRESPSQRSDFWTV